MCRIIEFSLVFFKIDFVSVGPSLVGAEVGRQDNARLPERTNPRRARQPSEASQPSTYSRRVAGRYGAVMAKFVLRI